MSAWNEVAGGEALIAFGIWSLPGMLLSHRSTGELPCRFAYQIKCTVFDLFIVLLNRNVEDGSSFGKKQGRPA